MPGPLSRLRERVGVRVFACRKGFVSHEHPALLSAPGVRGEAADQYFTAEERSWRSFAEELQSSFSPFPTPRKLS